MNKSPLKKYFTNCLKGYIKGYFKLESIFFAIAFSAIAYTPILLFVTSKSLSDRQEVLEYFCVALILYYILGFIFYITMWFVLNHRFYRNETKIESEGYYRDILKECSLIDLSYLDNRELDFESDIVATVLTLQLKGKIKISNGRITILDKNKDNLLRYEEIVLHLLTIDEQEYDSSKLIFKDDMLTILYQEGKYCELKKKFINDFKMFSMESIEKSGIAISLKGFSRLKNPNSIFYGFFGILIGITGHLLPVTLSMPKNSIINYAITSKGKEIEKQLLGMKMFLKDYSNMADKEFNEFGLWNEYMVYSVILNDNKKIKKEILEIIKKYLKEKEKSL